MTKKYIVTWCPAGADVEFLTIIDGDLELTIDQIVEIACAVEEIEPQSGHLIYSIIRADNVDVIV